MREAAHGYLDDAWSIFPVCTPVIGRPDRCQQHGACKSAGKTPLVRWGKYQDDLPTRDEIDSWWTRWPSANIALATGALSDVDVIDLDGELARAEALRRGYDPGAVVHTGRVGGEHGYFRHRVDAPTIFAKVGGIDFRGQGGYVLLPPSLHYSGTRYTWHEPIVRGEPLTDLPRWIDELAGTTLSGEPRGRVDFNRLLRDGVDEGQRDQELFRAAARLRGLDVPYEIAIGLIEQVAAQCHPPFPVVQARAKVDSAYERYQPNGTMVELIPTAAWPTLGEEAYHGLAGEIVRLIAPHTEADPAAILAQLLVAYGSSVGRCAYFVVESTRHFTNENIVLVGDTAKSRKGTSQDYVRLVMRAAAENWAAERVTGGLSSGEGLIAEVRDKVTKTEIIREKGRPTGETEEVVVDQGVSDKRLLLIETEFSRVLRMSNRESSILSQVLRDAWDSRDLRTMTRASPLRASQPHIAIVGHITRDELRRELSTTDAANGFGNRFIWLAVRRAHVLPFGGAELPAAELDDLVERLQEAIAFAARTSEMGMDDEAAAIWVEIYADLSAGKPGLLGSMIARGEAHVRRLAVLYALFDLSAIVRRVHLLAALAIWKCAEASTRWIFGDMLGDPVADTIFDALHGRGEMTRTEISDLFSHHREQSRISSALNALLAAGLAAMDKRATAGRPQEVWHVA
jgi:hypothetical protein